MDVCGRFKTALFEQEPTKFTINKAIFWVVSISLQLAVLGCPRKFVMASKQVLNPIHPTYK